MRLRLGRALRCAAQEKYILQLRLRLGLAMRCAAQENYDLRLRLGRALRCAAQRATCDCGCDWAEPCAALRKQSTSYDCD
jgi:hypothetical protein